MYEMQHIQHTVLIVIASVLLQAVQCVKTVVDSQLRDHFNTSCGQMRRNNISDVPVVDVNNITGSIDHFAYEIANGTIRHQYLGPCVRLLCQRGMWFTGSKCQNDSRLVELNVAVEFDDGIQHTVNIFEQFDHSVGATCNEIIQLDPDVWKLNKVKP